MLTVTDIIHKWLWQPYKEVEAIIPQLCMITPNMCLVQLIVLRDKVSAPINWNMITLGIRFFFLFFKFYFIFKLYNIVFVLPNIEMNPPQVYLCSPSWTLLPPHTIPLGCPSASAPSIQHHASNLDWRLISYMILYMFQCHSPKSPHPLPLPQSP